MTPQLLEELRLAYVGNRREVSANLTRLSTRYEMPKSRLKREALRQGWQMQTRRPWTAEEDALLLDAARKADYGRIGAELGRSWASIEARALALQRLQTVQRAAAAFDVEELAGLFGVSPPKVRRWIARGLFGKGRDGDGADRIPSFMVARFLRKHVREYSLERVNQSWFKVFVFGGGDKPPEGKTCL
jgi:hypothetical protein